MGTPIAVRTDVLAGIRQRWPELATSWSESVVTELQELCQRYEAEPLQFCRPDSASSSRRPPQPECWCFDQAPTRPAGTNGSSAPRWPISEYHRGYMSWR